MEASNRICMGCDRHLAEDDNYLVDGNCKACDDERTEAEAKLRGLGMSIKLVILDPAGIKEPLVIEGNGIYHTNLKTNVLEVSITPRVAISTLSKVVF